MNHLKQLTLLAALVFAAPALAQDYQLFGGMYGYSGNKLYPNPYTGGASCPQGYATYQILGTVNLDNPVYYCGRTPSGSMVPVADFGGLFSNGYVNTLTGAFNCPTGYTATRVLGTYGSDYELFFCHKAGTSNTRWRLGGMFGGYRSATAEQLYYPNPITTTNTCPADYVTSQNLGTPNVDYPVYSCFREMY
ncbi:MAG TPA: hypothetical protein VEU33_34950 [Archangium sp.]|nr:hypothetical protein [Archangium sp.]